MKSHTTLRQRLSALEQIVQDFLGLDDWSDDLIAPRSLIERAQALVTRPKPSNDFAGETPSSVPRWCPLRDGLVQDLQTGLVWSQTLACGRVNHAKAVQAAADLRFGGHTDWRLPTIQELLGLVDYSRSDPAIDKKMFPGTESAFYWSSTPYAPNPADYAWGVGFNYGFSYYYNRDNDYNVRAVRGPVVRPGQ